LRKWPFGSGRAVSVDDFVPLPLEDAYPVVNGAAAAFRHRRLEQIADLPVTQQQQTGREELAASLADPGILEGAGRGPEEIADTRPIFMPDASFGPVVQIHFAIVEHRRRAERGAKIFYDEPGRRARFIAGAIPFHTLRCTDQSLLLRLAVRV